jgi:hypothetical protein
MSSRRSSSSTGSCAPFSEGYLVDVKALAVEADMDLTNVTTAADDYTSASLGTELTTRKQCEGRAA